MIIIRLVMAIIFGTLALGFGYAVGFLIKVEQPWTTGIVCGALVFLATLFVKGE